jgi:hypothetical protein
MAKAPGSKLRYDDFVAAVHPDPAKPEPTILLSGFVGRADAAGTARIYPDQSLGTWYDVAEGDIVHSAANPDAPLGGSHVWVKANAPIKPGTAAPAPAAAQRGVGQLPHQTLATLCTQLCTHAGCPPPGLTQPVICGVLPPSFGCTHVGCPPAGLTLPVMCGILPPSVGCPPPHPDTPNLPRMAAGAAALPHTNPIVCTQGAMTFCGCTPGFDCMAPGGGLQTHAPICTQGFPTICGCTPGIACMAPGVQAAAFAPTPSAVNQCGPQAAAIGHPTPQTHCFVCDPIAARPAAAAAMMPTPATHCFICPPHTLSWNCHAAAGPQAAFAPTPSAVNQCGPQAAAMAPTPTPATHCFICPPHTQDRNCWGAGAVDARLQTVPCPTPNGLCGDTIMRTPDCERFAPTLRTSWFECHTHMPGCTVHVCFQGAPAAAAAGPLQTHFVCTQGVATFCGCTPGFDCMQPPGGVQTHAPICTQGIATFCGCPPGTGLGPCAATVGGAAITQCCHPNHPAGFTPATLCTRPPACPPHPVTAATICTAVPGCPGPLTPQTPTGGCGQTVLCGNTLGCGVFNPFGG